MAINASGQVLGHADTASGVHPFLYDATCMHDLTTLGGRLWLVNAINDSGQVVGYSTTASGEQHPFLHDATGMHDLGTLGGFYSQPFAINNSGQVVGYSYTSGNAGAHAFLYDATGMHDLGTLGGTFSQALAINNSGQVAGFAYTTGNAAAHAFLVKANPVFSALVSPSIVYGKATTTLSGHLAAGTADPAAGETESVTLNSLTQPATLDSSGNFSTTFSTGSLGVTGSPYTVSYSYAGDNLFSSASGSSTLTVTPAPLSATAINFSATAGAPSSGPVATFANADPFGSATSYTALITWGDGSQSAGVITGSGTLTVSGSHTYTDPVNETVSVQISHNLGYTTTATTSGTATVTSLGVQPGQAGGIGFWHNNGQALITSFNGGSNSTALSAWLAATFPNLYGAGAGANNLTGKTNAQVAAFYLSQFALSGPKVEAQVLAVALNVYATTSSLGGSAGVAYGFTVSATGLGARSFNVGADGAAFDVANNTTRNVYQLLKAVNKKAVAGVLYNGDALLRQQAADLFDALNSAGGI
jgi:probable HAF family extracellular repeat protein